MQLSHKAAQELRKAGASASLRRDFEKMEENVRRAGSKMELDDLLAFLTAAGKMFRTPNKPRAHQSYTRVLI